MSLQPFQSPSGTKPQEVPAFLKGQPARPTYRASGSVGVDHYAYADSTPFGSNQGAKAFSPAPLKFSQYAGPQDHGWGVAPSVPQPGLSKSKKLDQSLDNLHFSQLSLVSGSSYSTAPHQSDSAAPKEYAQDLAYSSEDDLRDSDIVSVSQTSASASSRSRSSQILVQSPSLVLTAVTGDASSVLAKVTRSLGSGIDYKVDQPSMTVRAVVSRANEFCVLSIRVLAHGGNSYLAEFQRKTGPQNLFLETFTRVSDSLAKLECFSNVLVKDPVHDLAASLSDPTATISSSTSTRTFETVSHPATPTTDPAVPILDSNSVHLLVEMCASEFEDVKREAFSTISQLSGSATAQAIIARTTCPNSAIPAIIPVLTTLHHTNNIDLHWFGTRVLANVCREAAFCAHTQTLLPMLFALLASSPAGESLMQSGVRRHAASALELITRNQPDMVMQSQSHQINTYLKVLSDRFDCKDPVVQSSVRNIINQMSG